MITFMVIGGRQGGGEKVCKFERLIYLFDNA